MTDAQLRVTLVRTVTFVVPAVTLAGFGVDGGQGLTLVAVAMVGVIAPHQGLSQSSH